MIESDAAHINLFSAVGGWIDRRGFRLAVFALLGLLFVLVLLTSQRHADGDEAVVGVMAQHILGRGTRPLFFYGQSYGSGAALEAFLAAAAFALFGQSGVVLKGVALCLFGGALAMLYRIGVQQLNGRTAFWLVLLLGVATPAIEWRTKMRGGYAAVPLFACLLIYCYLKLLDDGANRSLVWFAFGLCAGLAYLNSSLVLSLFVALALVLLLDWRIILRPQMGLFFVGLPLGLSPLIVHELRHGFPHLAYVRGLSSDPLMVAGFWGSLTELLPKFFVGNNVDGYVSAVPLGGMAELGVYACFFLAGCVIGLGGWGAADGGRVRLRLIQLSVVGITVHLILFAMSRLRVDSPRYLYPLLLWLVMLAVLVTATLWHEKKQVLSIVGCVGIGWLLLHGVWQNVTYVGPAVVTDDLLNRDWQVVNVPTRGDLAQDLIDLLQEKGVKYVKTGYFLQWRLVFESQEQIIASSADYFPTVPRFPEYDADVNAAGRFAIILHKESRPYADTIELDWIRPFEQIVVDDYVVLISPE